MQSWAIKIDIKLNIDDLNWSVDGQIIEDIKSENVFSHVRRSWQDWQDSELRHYKTECHNILHIISGEYFQVHSDLSSVSVTLSHVSINIDL